MNSYELSRNWFDWCFDNPDKVKPNHIALYFFCIEHCNRLGWQEKFGLPTEMAKSAIGIHSYNTYISTLNDLIEFGFIKLITKSKNQFSSNIIGLSNFDKATTKALDKAIIKHVTKQGESNIESIDSINKPLTNTETINQETIIINDNTNALVVKNENFIKFEKWILENCPQVAKMKEPFTESQFLKISKDFSRELIKETIEAMHNKKDLLKKYNSANLTLRSWINLKNQKNGQSTSTDKTDAYDKLSETIRNFGNVD